ncbi:unnamed protein product [Moneuplotes crassus]|uniref:Serine aminopeptidase S33 domain-containing protein n=1 Tax=Euplotes crassus TaxID=5936 RepID=A0AAD1XM14_EUPCR|nr:unnamed protein product [Moneuplotes crassus]
MELNTLIFPAPNSSYDQKAFEKDLIYIPRRTSDDHFKPRETGNKKSKKQYIPCLFLPYTQGSTKIMIYFHGNAEDLGQAYQLLNHIRNTLKLHVIAVEFPGYGIYPGTPNSKEILEDANTVFEFITDRCDWKPKDIILFGRSIGTGPATELAAGKEPGALLLMSGYTSIRGVVKHISGYFTQYLVAERFNNLEMMSYVKCPTFLIHGQQDELIPYSHSERLHEKCGGPCTLVLPAHMDHNEFDFFDDLSHPFYFFLLQCNVSIKQKGQLVFPPEVYNVPDNIAKGRKKRRACCTLMKLFW